MKIKSIISIINNSLLRKMYPETYDDFMPEIIRISKAFSGTIKTQDLRSDDERSLDFRNSPLNNFTNKDRFRKWITPNHDDEVSKQQRESEISNCLRNILNALIKFEQNNPSLEIAQKGLKRKTIRFASVTGVLSVVFGSLSGLMVDILTSPWDNPWIIVFLVMTFLGVLFEIINAVKNAKKRDEMHYNRGDEHFEQKYNKYINIIIGRNNQIVQKEYNIYSRSDEVQDIFKDEE